MKKRIYILLCMLLGVVLLLIIQRALFAIYIIVADTYPAYNLLATDQLQIVNWITVGLAILVGLVYGNYLGHHWYPLVYGEKSNIQAPSGMSSSSSDLEPVQKTVTIKPVRVPKPKVNLKSEVREESWDFDDLLSHDAPAVEGLSGAGPSVVSAVSLGESEPSKPSKEVKKVGVRKTVAKKAVTKSKTVKTATKAPAKAIAKTSTSTTTKKIVTKTAVKKPLPKVKVK